jgi:hypothetical protein
MQAAAGVKRLRRAIFARARRAVFACHFCQERPLCEEREFLRCSFFFFCSSARDNKKLQAPPQDLFDFSQQSASKTRRAPHFAVGWYRALNSLFRHSLSSGMTRRAHLHLNIKILVSRRPESTKYGVCDYISFACLLCEYSECTCGAAVCRVCVLFAAPRLQIARWCAQKIIRAPCLSSCNRLSSRCLFLPRPSARELTRIEQGVDFMS